MTFRRFNVGVIGLGFIGPEHVRNLRRLDSVNVEAVADPDNVEGRAEKAGIHVPKYFSDWRHMIDDKSIDAVHVCAPNQNHREIVLAALDAGKHVICEKPLATNPEDTREMVYAARKAVSRDIFSMVNFNYTGHQLPRHAKHLVQSGKLGDLRFMRGDYFQDWLQYMRDFSASRCFGDSCAFADIGSHATDMLLNVSGMRPESLIADLETYNPVRQKPNRPLNAFEDPFQLPDSEFTKVPITSDDYAHVIMFFPNRVRGVVTATQVYAGMKNDLRVEFVGSEHSYAWNQTRPDEAWMGHRFGPNELIDRGTIGDCLELARLSDVPPKHPFGYGRASGNQFREFYESAAKGEIMGDYPLFERGHNVACVTASVLKSKKSGGREAVDYLGL